MAQTKVQLIEGTASTLFIDTSGRVLIGTASGTGNSGTKLVLHDSSSPRLRLTNSTTGEAASDGGEISLDGSNLHIENRESAAIKFYSGGSERAQLDSSGNLKFNSGYGSVATAYGCRAWVNFNGTGTVAIRASGNVSSITDNGTSEYIVNLATAMPDANFAVAAATTENPGVTSDVTTCINSDYTSSAIRVVLRAAGSSYDATSVFLSVFR